MTSSPAAETGNVIDNYHLIEEIGEGTFGVVHRAKVDGGGRDVALKLLYYEDLDMDPEEVVERCRREVQLAREIEHPHAAEVLDFGEMSDGVYVVREYVQGDRLNERIAREGALETSLVVRIAAAVLDVLHFAHQKDIVHRDLKPGNIKLCRDGESDVPMLLDFGTAKTIHPEFDLTSTNMALGSPAYMAPEAIVGKRPGPASDLYSLGLTLAEAVSGQQVVTGKTPVVCANTQVSPEPLELPEAVVDHPLHPWLKKALAKDEEERFSSAALMLYELEQLDIEIPDDHLEMSAMDDPEAAKTMRLHAVAGPAADADEGSSQPAASPEASQEVDPKKTVPLQAVTSPDASPETQRAELEEALGDAQFEVSGDGVSTEAARPSQEEARQQNQSAKTEAKPVSSPNIGERFATMATQAITKEDEDEPSKVILLPIVIFLAGSAVLGGLFATGLMPGWVGSFWIFLGLFLFLGLVLRALLKGAIGDG